LSNISAFCSDVMASIKAEEAPVENPPQQSAPAQQQQQAPHWGNWLPTSAPVFASVLSKLQSPTSVMYSSSKEEMRPMLMGPLSSRRVVVEEHDEDDPMQHHVVAVSSSVLGADEQAELERMRMAMTAPHPSMDPLTMVLTNIKQNPHFAFIGFTLVLCYVVYFYSRHKEEIDEVT